MFATQRQFLIDRKQKSLNRHLLTPNKKQQDQFDKMQYEVKAKLEMTSGTADSSRVPDLSKASRNRTIQVPI